MSVVYFGLLALIFMANLFELLSMLISLFDLDLDLDLYIDLDIDIDIDLYLDLDYNLVIFSISDLV